MTFQKDKVNSQSEEMRTVITKLDAELTEDFESQMSIAPYLSRKMVSFQGNKTKQNPHTVGINIRKRFLQDLLNTS